MKYGYTDKGAAIVAPDGWVILPEGAAIPSVHRECSARGHWMTPRRCRSTMTPIYAKTDGYVRCFAVPIK